MILRLHQPIRVQSATAVLSAVVSLIYYECRDYIFYMIGINIMVAIQISEYSAEFCMEPLYCTKLTLFQHSSNFNV